MAHHNTPEDDTYLRVFIDMVAEIASSIVAYCIVAGTPLTLFLYGAETIVHPLPFSRCVTFSVCVVSALGFLHGVSQEADCMQARINAIRARREQ